MYIAPFVISMGDKLVWMLSHDEAVTHSVPHDYVDVVT